jgi:hypothetical protein
MPAHSGTENGKCFYQWGQHGAKYFYTCGDKQALERAKNKANKQGQAEHAYYDKINAIINYINQSKNDCS